MFVPITNEITVKQNKKSTWRLLCLHACLGNYYISYKFIDRINHIPAQNNIL